MDAELNKFGNTIPVPSVVELSKQPMVNVPERYVRPNQDPPVVLNSISLPQVPVIDMNKLLSDDAAEFENLDHACKQWGFFQMINHGVNLSLVENVKIGAQEFLNLPMDEKKKFWQKPGDLEGFGQLFVVSENQKLDWADLFYIHTLPSHARNPHLFPNIPQPFRDNLDKYCLELNKLCLTILEFMTRALRMEPNESLELFEDGFQSMRMNYYPPCPQPEHVIGIRPHSDAGALTILLQVNEIEGLQIRKDGIWIPIRPLCNAFVINVGDTLKILTNGIYRSVEHRAIVNSEKERISIATFYRPQMKTVIGPAKCLVTTEKPAMFRRIELADYYKGFFSHELQGKSFIDTMRIQDENGKS